MSSNYYSNLKMKSQRKRRKPKRKKNNFAAKVKRIVTGMSEKKVIHLQRTVSIDNTGTFYPLASIAEGSTNYQREGDEINVTRVDLYYQIEKADTTNTMRVIVFSKEGSTVPSAIAEILQSTSQYGVLAPYLQDRTYGFKIHYDEAHTVHADKEFTDIIRAQVKFPGDGLKLHYNDSGATAYGNRSLWLVMLSDSGAATHPQIVQYTTTHYIDL